MPRDAAIDWHIFAPAYEERAGSPWSAEPKQTLGELFRTLQDPDDWDTVAEVLAAAKRATRLQPTTLQADPLISFPPQVYAGDLHVETDFTFNNHVLVLGDLLVDGVITAPPAHAILMVAGDIRCCAANLLQAYVFTTGDLRAKDAFLGSCNGFAYVAGTVTTRLYMHAGWTNRSAPDGEETSLDNVRGTVVNLDDPDEVVTLGDVLTKGTVVSCTKDGTFDAHALMARIAQGEEVFASTPSGRKP